MPLPRCLMPPPKTRKARWTENDGVWKPPPSLAHHGCRPKSGPGCQLKCRPGPTASSAYKSCADGWRTPTRCHPGASGPMPCVLPGTLRDAHRPGQLVRRPASGSWEGGATLRSPGAWKELDSPHRIGAPSVNRNCNAARRSPVPRLPQPSVSKVFDNVLAEWPKCMDSHIPATVH